MSDIFPAYDLSKFKQKVSISSVHCLNYVIRDAIADNEIAFTVNIPYEQQRSWYEFKEERPLVAVEFSYLQILNVFLQEYGPVKIQQDVTRIDSLLRRTRSEDLISMGGRRPLITMQAQMSAIPGHVNLETNFPEVLTREAGRTLL